MAQTVKHLSTTRESQVRSLGREDPLEKGMATHSSILAWEIPLERGAWWATVHGITKESDTTQQLNNSKTKVYTNNKYLKIFKSHFPFHIKLMSERKSTGFS